MDTDLNHCVLAGVLECAPITRFADPRHADDGLYPHTHRARPRRAGVSPRCPPGESVLVAGKLPLTSWTTTDGMQKTSLAVLARPIKVLTPASVTTDDHNEETTPLSRSGALKPHHRDGWR